MVIRRVGLVAAALVFPFIAGASPALEQATLFLDRGEPNAAKPLLQSIHPGNGEWIEKLNLLIRYHLLRGPAIEAWRVIQVGRRTTGGSNRWRDEERLAVFLAGACPLALAPEDEPRGWLLDAAVDRLRGRIFEADAGTPLGARAAGERRLGPGLVPYLADIPRTKLLANQGCRFAKWERRSKESRARNELDLLRRFLDRADSAGTRVERLLIRMRALELAEADAKLADEAKALREKLPAASDVDWSALPDPERKWLLARLFAARRLEEVAPERRPEAQAIALASLREGTGTGPADWLALVDLGRLPNDERIVVLSRAEASGRFAGRSWVLLELARSLAEANRVNDSLTVVRRLLREHEEELSADETAAAVELASKLFAEFTFDERTTSAVHAAVPEALWTPMLARTELRFAFAGRAVELAKLHKNLDHARGAGFRSDDRRELVTAIARKDLGRFRRTLDEGERRARRGQRLADFAADYLAELGEQGNPLVLRGFTRELAVRLRRADAGRGELRDRLTDLALSLDQSGTTAEAEESVRRGIVRLGTARWRHATAAPPTFVLRPPDALPLRRLFYMPASISSRSNEWILSTALDGVPAAATGAKE